MKAIYLLVSLFTLSSIVSGQIISDNIFKLKPSGKSKLFQPLPAPKLVYGKVYVLPQDNMPCFVPDITVVAKIPNMQFYLPLQKMPNPYTPTHIFPGLNNGDKLFYPYPVK